VGAVDRAKASVILTVDQTAPWVGFMNVSELPSNGGAYVFGSPWGPNDLVSVFDNPNSKLSLYAAPIGTSDGFWYVGGVGMPGAAGNKNMSANLYVEVNDNSLSGQSLTFEGTVLANTLISPWTSVAFIKDFAPDFSSVNVMTVPLTPGPFSVSLVTAAGPGRHVQYGFETIGPNVFPTDLASKGNVMIATVVPTIPEPATALMAGMAAIAGVGLLRRRKN
jgi:hypothetical protein